MPYRVGLGLGNLAYKRPVYQSSTWSSTSYGPEYYVASNAVDGDLSALQYFYGKSCSLTNAVPNHKSYLVIDLHKASQVHRTFSLAAPRQLPAHPRS